MPKSWRDVIKQVMFEKGMNQMQLSQHLQKSQSTVSHWMAGTRTPPLEDISEIMKKLGIQYLIFDAFGRFSTPGQNGNSYQDKSKGYVVEALNVQLCTNTGVLIDIEAIDSVMSIEYSRAKAHQMFGTIPANNIKILTVKGDSMADTLEAGDLVFVHISKRFYDGDGIYVFVFGSTLFVKRLQKIKDKILVISDNKHYSRWDVLAHEIDQMQILGKVLLSQTHKLSRYG